MTDADGPRSHPDGSTPDADAPSTLVRLVQIHDAELTPNDRRIASHVLANPAEVAYASADDVAQTVGVSKAAIVRFGARLGLGGFAGLQELLAAEVRRRLDRSPRQGMAGHVLERLHAAVVDDLRSTMEATDGSAIDRAAALLETGEGWIHVFGQRKSGALAGYAYFLLNPILPNVILVEAGESALADQLLDVGPEDRLLALTFRRYAKLTGDVVEYFAERGAPVVLLTDAPGAPGASVASEVLVVADDAPSRFATATTGVFLIEVLVAALLERNPQTSGRRLDDAERVWDRFHTYDR